MQIGMTQPVKKRLVNIDENDIKDSETKSRQTTNSVSMAGNDSIEKPKLLTIIDLRTML